MGLGCCPNIEIRERRHEKYGAEPALLEEKRP